MGPAPDSRTLTIGNRDVGRGHAPYVIGEISANHGGRLDDALELVDRIAEAGADAAKIQTYRAGSMTIDADLPWFRIDGGTPWDGRTLQELYESASTPWEWTGPLVERARSNGIDLISTPFDAEAVAFLEEFDLPAYKIASFEMVDLELVRRVAATGRPVIMSTGLATLSEIDEAVTAARDAGSGGLGLLRCNSAYPTPVADMDLRTIPHMEATWGVPVGLSDHSLGSAAAVAAVTLGASLIEKHVTLSRSDGTADAAFSAEPAEFTAMVADIRDASSALGTVRYGPTASEHASLVFRRSLFAVRTIPAGGRLTRDDVASIRPGNGLHPRHLVDVIGRRALDEIPRGTPLDWSLLD